jgi:hypothetical protein
MIDAPSSPNFAFLKSSVGRHLDEIDLVLRYESTGSVSTELVNAYLLNMQSRIQALLAERMPVLPLLTEPGSTQ